MSLLQRVGVFFLNVVVGPLLAARERADEDWRRDALARQRARLPAHATIRARLMASTAPMPEELRAPSPRPNVWKDRPQAMSFLPLLTTGVVTRGIVLSYEQTGDVDGIDAAAIYAWLDESEKVRLHELAASFDPVHAALGPSLTDAGTLLALEAGREITVVFDPSSGHHVVYEALAK